MAAVVKDEEGKHANAERRTNGWEYKEDERERSVKLRKRGRDPERRKTEIDVERE